MATHSADGHDGAEDHNGDGSGSAADATSEELLNEAIELVADTRAMPMSSTIKVNKDELLDLLEGVRELLPLDLRDAQELLRQREEFIAQARQERDDLIDQGRTQVSRMVERQEVVKAADFRARQIVEDARLEAADLRRQVEDYCDQKLASFEVVLDKTARTVQQGREKLLGGQVQTASFADGPPPPADVATQQPVDLRDEHSSR